MKNLLYSAHLIDVFGKKDGNTIIGQFYNYTKTKNKMILFSDKKNYKYSVIGYDIDECIEAANKILSSDRTREKERWIKCIEFLKELKQNYYLDYKVLPVNDTSIKWHTKTQSSNRQQRINRVKRKKKSRTLFIKKWNETFNLNYNN